MTAIMDRHDSIVILPMQSMSVFLPLHRVMDHQGVLDGIYFRPMIQRGSEQCSGCMVIPKILSSLKTRILALLLCVNWNLSMESRRARSFNVKEMQSSSPRGVLIR